MDDSSTVNVWVSVPSVGSDAAWVSIISLVPATLGNTVSSVPVTFSAEVDCSTTPLVVRDAGVNTAHESAVPFVVKNLPVLPV